MKTLCGFLTIYIIVIAMGCTTDFTSGGDADADATDTLGEADTSVDSPVDMPDTMGDTTDAVDDTVVGPDCGNGEPDEGEECDDGNDVDGDGCDSDCTWTCETNDECLDDDPCNGEEYCDIESFMCFAGEPRGDGWLVSGGDTRIICLGGESVVSRCGDGWHDVPVEECEDGNVASGDGCSALCRADHECLVTLDGGSPAEFSFVVVQPEGYLSIPSAHAVAGTTHEPGLVPTFQKALAACGRNVYAVVEGSSQILHFSLDFVGNTTVGTAVGFPGVHGLVCDAASNLLFGYALLDPNTVEVRSYVIGTAGALSDGYSCSIDVGPTTGVVDTEISNGMMLQHPASGDLWAFAVWEDWMTGDSGTDGVHLSFDGSGGLALLDGPRSIGSVDFFYTLYLSPSGHRLIMPGYSGGCLGWYEVGSAGNLPDATLFGHVCSGNFSGSKHAVHRATDDVFYFTRNATSSIYIAEFIDASTVTEHGQYAAAGDGAHLHLLYDDTVLVSLARDGDIRSFTASPDGQTLGYVNDISVSTGGYLESSVMMRCTL